MVTIRSSTRSPLTTNTRLVPPLVRTAARRHEHAGRLRGLLDPGRREEPGLQLAVRVRARPLRRSARADPPRARARCTAPAPRTAGPDTRRPRRATGWPTAIAETNCSGIVSRTRSGLTRTTTATFMPLRDVVADRDQPLGDDAVERAHARRCRRAPCAPARRGRAPPAATGTAARRRSWPPRTAGAPLPSACAAGRTPIARRRADRAATGFAMNSLFASS